MDGLGGVVLADAERADAIVVLGGRLTPDGGCGPGLARRVACGVGLFRAGRAPMLVMSGGGAARCTEASVMRDAAVAAGVPATAIIVEDRSMNTFENAREVAALLRERGLDRILLVTDGYHLRRARFLFAAAGVRVAAGVASHRHPPHRAFFYAVWEFMAWLRNLPRLMRARA